MDMSKGCLPLALVLVMLALPCVQGLAEPGIFEMTITETKNLAIFTKSMYTNSSVNVKLKCQQDDNVELDISWWLRFSPCAQEFANIDKDIMEHMYMQSQIVPNGLPYDMIEYKKDHIVVECHSAKPIDLVPESPTLITEPIRVNGSRITSYSTEVGQPANSGETSRKKRQAEGEAPVPVPGSTTVVPGASSTIFPAVNPQELNQDGEKLSKTALVHTWRDGVFMFAIRVVPVINGTRHNVTVEVSMTDRKGGYLSAIEWPLLPFYGIMCVIYIFYGLVWLFLSFCNWRDLLRVQLWIGGVIFLGMLEKAVFFGEYESVNNTGKSVQGAIVIATIISCMKRTLARMLVIIVSLGFGIVKPRLGPTLHKVLALGGLYFILSSVEGCMNAIEERKSQSTQTAIASIPLAVVDAAFCWWIFTALAGTMRTLRLRRNLVKLSLYRHFTNTLIFAVLASVAYMIWSITQHKFTKCLTDWTELWVDEAFWHLLFSVILLVIMVLWRPSANNQRYAFSPLLDAADDEAGEPMINDAFDGMKMRGVKGQANGSPGNTDKSKVEDDLKWIDDNIPSSVADTALPSLLDSDEEMMNTKYEMSKME